MKIAFVVINANRREGTSRAIVEVAIRLARSHDVTVIARGVDVDLPGCSVHQTRGPVWPDIAEFECFRVQAEHFLRRNDFDIVHSAGCNVRLADVFAIQTVHPVKMQINAQMKRDQSVSSFRRLTRWSYDRRILQMERAAYQPQNDRGVVGYLPVSSGTRAELLSNYDVHSAMIRTIPNAADIDHFHPKLSIATCAQTREQWGLTDDHFVLLFAGGEWRRKGLDLAIEALALIDDAKVVLVVAGRDPQAAEFSALAAERNVKLRVHWLGFQSEIDQVYAAADLFLFPTAYEAFSLATIEAAACGLPVVMSDVSGAAELCGDGQAGRIVDRNPLAIAQAVMEIRSSPELLRQLRLGARAKVEACFTWDKVAAETEEFYDELLSARHGV